MWHTMGEYMQLYLVEYFPTTDLISSYSKDTSISILYMELIFFVHSNDGGT